MHTYFVLNFVLMVLCFPTSKKPFNILWCIMQNRESPIFPGLLWAGVYKCGLRHSQVISYWGWILFNLFPLIAAEKKHQIHFLLCEMPECNWCQSSLCKFNITLKLHKVRLWWELYLPQGIKGLQIRATASFLHSQAPTDTFHPGSPSALLPKHNLFHIVRVCKLESTAHIAQQPQRVSAVRRGVELSLWLLKVGSGFRVSYWVHRSCIMVTPDLKTVRLNAVIMSWTFFFHIES